MTSEERKRFTVITNKNFENETGFKEKHKSYQTNPLTEKLMKFTNNEAGHKFSIEDLLKW
ncbi:MAG: hypothetical protein KIC88_00360 [Acinetobacter sp.]|nr:hypothetical protein [Acinetobacter sp.]DAB11968.1 MAG TPA: hypothetical protein CPT91_05360 [Candidatus Gastranaerophilales bacterium HUM_16]